MIEYEHNNDNDGFRVVHIAVENSDAREGGKRVTNFRIETSAHLFDAGRDIPQRVFIGVTSTIENKGEQYVYAYLTADETREIAYALLAELHNQGIEL